MEASLILSFDTIKGKIYFFKFYGFLGFFGKKYSNFAGLIMTAICYTKY